MIGAIIGDVVGSIYERNNIKSTKFPLFVEKSQLTDDTVLTVAVADAVLNNIEFEDSVKNWGNKYPKAGYGYNFQKWLKAESPEPYNSWGNGSAMRVSPIGFYYNSLEKVLEVAKKSAEITHNHPEGIKGAQATATAIFLSREGKTKKEIKQFIEKTFHYDLSRKIDDIRATYSFDVSCQGSVPESIIAFLESDDFESSIRLAVSIGGDSDTIACITGGISQAFYKKIDSKIVKAVKEKLPSEMIKVVENFELKIGWKY